MEGQNIRQEREGENVVIWRNTKGEVIVRVEIDESTGIKFWSRKGAISELEERMREENFGSIFLNQKVVTDHDDELVFQITPGHNWNTAKKDFITTVNSWLNPPVLAKK